MHVLQYIVVEVEDQLADPKQEAAEIAESLLNQEMGDGEATNTWFDWFVVGGGRWNDEQDQYKNSSNMVISYEEDPNAFNGKLQELIANRIDTYNEYLAEVKDVDIMAKLDNYGGVLTYDMELYALGRLLAYQQGRWDYDSKFYDMVNWSTNATHILAKISNNEGKNLYLVPIDFHF